LLVYLSRCDVVLSAQANTKEALVVAKIEISLRMRIGFDSAWGQGTG
jgi:hypothetical protein